LEGPKVSSGLYLRSVSVWFRPVFEECLCLVPACI
jgi:hypothetical protein